MIQWVLKAISKNDAREILTYVQIRDGRMIAVDGFRVHDWQFANKAALDALGDEKPDPTLKARGQLMGLASGLYEIHIYGPIVEIIPFESKLSFPDVDKAVEQIGSIPQTESLPEHAACHAILNQKFILDALSAPIITENRCPVHWVQGFMTRVFYPGEELSAGGEWAKATIMAMYPGPYLGPIEPVDFRRFKDRDAIGKRTIVSTETEKAS
jgi:hypothetical protein